MGDRRPGRTPGAAYTWGDDPEQPGQRLANYWHGEFPYLPDTGYGTTSTRRELPPNGYGLFDMAGNVWEWTADWYTETREPTVLCRRQLTTRPAAVPDPAQGDQGRVVPVCRQLLPALPAGRAPAADG